MASPKIHNNTNNYYGKPKDPQNYKKTEKTSTERGLTLKPLVEYPEKTTNLS
jgi:hypothetical protein